MIKFNSSKILIPVDFSKTSIKAIKHAAFIAKVNKGELILLNVQKKNELIDVILPALKLKNTSAITDFLGEKLEKLAQGIRKEYGIKVTSLVSLGHITSEIVDIAKENKVGLIVMGTQGGDSQSSVLLGSNAYRVLTKAHCPVMTVRANTADIGYKNIILPIDSSLHTRQKVMATLQFAEKFASKIHVLGVLGKGEESYKHSLEVILRQIEKLAGKNKLSCTTTIVKSSDSSATIVKFATKHNADLISIMSDQHGGVSKLLGSFAHHIINDSKTPVLTFKPESHSETESFSVGGLW